jgi:cobalt/nickel transport system ATP-binding protein
MTRAVVVRNLSVNFVGKNASGAGALDNVSFEVSAGERVSLIGPNGAGKTTLLLALVGAVEFQGSIEIDGVPLIPKNLERIRRQVGFVFSNPDDQLFCESVEEEVRFGTQRADLSETERSARTQRALACVGLSGFERRHPSELSLGEKRRLAAACALAYDTRLFLFDEPTASLDPVSRRRMLDVLGEHPGTVLIATHDLEAAQSLESRALVLSRGQLLADGAATELLRDTALLERAGLHA